MKTTELGTAAGGDGFPTALDERQDEHIGTVVPEQHGSADYEDFGEGDQGGFADADDRPLTAEESAQLARELPALFEEQDRQDVVSVQPAADSENQERADAAMEAQGDDVVDTGATECPSPSTLADAGAAGEAIGAAGPSTSATYDDTSANSSSADELVSDEEQTSPQLYKEALEVLLDESTGELVALEDFDGEVDVEAYRRYWFGSHSAISLATFQVEHHQKGKCTAHVDGAGKLISDPDVFLLARKDGVPITLCVHEGLTEDQKIEFMLRRQACYRFRTEAEERKLKNATIEVQLRLGFDYETIAEMVRVSVNTVRNVENRAATNPNSKLGITKRPDGRFSPETLAKIAEAAELRKAGMGNAQIAEIFDTDVESVGRWFKDPATQGKTKNKDKPGKKRKTSLGTSEAQPKEPIKDTAASHDILELHRRVIEHFGRDFTAYDESRNSAADNARQASEAVSKNADKLLYLSLYGSQLADAANTNLERLLSTSGEVDVKEASPADSSSDAGNYRPDFDHRSNPYAGFAGLNAGPTEREVV